MGNTSTIAGNHGRKKQAMRRAVPASPELWPRSLLSFIRVSSSLCAASLLASSELLSTRQKLVNERFRESFRDVMVFRAVRQRTDQLMFPRDPERDDWLPAPIYPGAIPK